MTTRSRSLVVSLALASTLLADGYITDFDRTADWDWHMSGLWNVDSMAWPDQTASYDFRSAPSSLNYNNRNGNIVTGAPGTGEAISPVIHIGHMTSPVLRFWCQYETGSAGTGSYDRRFVRILDRTNVVLASYELGSVGATPGIGNCPNMNSWHEHVVSLNASWGHVKLSCLFDSGNEPSYAGRGWFIDDLSVLSGSTASSPTTSTWYTTTFESAASWSKSGLWAADGNPSTMPGGAYRGSWPSSLNHNDGVDYDTGTRASGEATSPMISIPSAGATLTFWCNYKTETTTTYYDQRWVRIRRVAGLWDTTGTLLSQYQLAGSGGTTGAGSCAAMGTWHQHSISIPGSAGSIRISFFFDTIDSYANAYPGWFVEDLSVSTTTGTAPTTSGVPLAAAYANVFETTTGWTVSGLWAADGSPTTVPGGASASGTASLNYNNGTSFSTGSTTSGDARSPVLELSGLQRPVLVFRCNYQTETAGTTYDKRHVVLESDSGAVLASHQLAGNGGSAAAGACATMGAWHQHTVPLDPAWRTARVVFRFNSVDGVYNSGAGWFVDDLHLDQPDLRSFRRDLSSGLTVTLSDGRRMLGCNTGAVNAGLAPVTYLGSPDGLMQVRLVGPTGVWTTTRWSMGMDSDVRARRNSPTSFPDFGLGRSIWPGWVDVDDLMDGRQWIDITSAPDGDYTLECTMDPGNRIAESDESNNGGAGIRIRIQGTTVRLIPEQNP